MLLLFLQMYQFQGILNPIFLKQLKNCNAIENKYPVSLIAYRVRKKYYYF